MSMISVLFSAAVTLVMLQSYTNFSSVVLILPVLFSNYLVFRFCDFCKRKSRVFYLLALTAIVAYMIVFAYYRFYSVTFFEWLYISLTHQDFTLYFVGFFIFCSFVISSVVYYFTVFVYRSLFLFIVLMIPYALNYTRQVDIPPVYTVLAIGLYFALMIFLGKKDIKTAATKLDNRIVYVFLAAVCFVASITTVIELPRSERRPGVGDGQGGSNVSGLLEHNRYSGDADFDQSNEEILFLVESDEQLHFIRQVFVRYQGDRWEFLFGSDLNSGPFDWEEAAESLNFDSLFSLALEADDAGHLTAPLQQRGIMENLTDVERVKTAVVIPQENRFSSSIIAPPRTFGVSGLGRGARHARNSLGEIFLDRAWVDSQYTLTYYSDLFRGNRDFQRLAHISMDEYEALLYELLAYSFAGDDGTVMLINYLSELSDAKRSGEFMHGFQSARITDLALEITEGLSGDYEKAAAIEQYFLGGGYRYDADNSFIEANRDIEHFIFESRSGTCGHYATAMALMARSIGLNARYVEGFTSAEINEQGQYVIRARNSHAFVQVHVPFYGWVTFDPTVPFEDGGSSFAEHLLTTSVGIFATLSIMILVGWAGNLLYTRVIKEVLFRFKASRSSGSEGIILIYARVIKLAQQHLDAENVSAATLAAKIQDKYGLDISPITSCFERAYFGDECISKEEKDKAFELYERLHKYAHKQLTVNSEQ